VHDIGRNVLDWLRSVHMVGNRVVFNGHFSTSGYMYLIVFYIYKGQNCPLQFLIHVNDINDAVHSMLLKVCSSAIKVLVCPHWVPSNVTVAKATYLAAFVLLSSIEPTHLINDVMLILCSLCQKTKTVSGLYSIFMNGNITWFWTAHV